MSTITDGSATFAVRNIRLIKGIIMAFSGTFDSNGYPIDTDTGLADIGWHVCDGTNGTPDLRGRFILGANDGYVVGSTGGEENHTLNVNEIPSHSHTGTTSWNGDHTHNMRRRLGYTNNSSEVSSWGCGTSYFTGGEVAQASTETAGGHNHTFTTNNAGGSQPHNNMPPYYALSYIMKI